MFGELEKILYIYIMKTGIYTITNLINQKIYLGCTFDFSKRKHQHFKELKLNIHKNKHLQSSFNKYGEEFFIFEILIECDKQQLISEEHYWGNLLRVHEKNYGYNNRPTHPYNKIIVTPEMKEKQRLKMTGRKLSKESINKRTETRKKNALLNGFYHSPSTKLKIGRKGKTVTDEVKKKISKTLTGVKKTKEQIQNVINGRKGYKHSQETKNKIGNANRRKITI